jgi:hypothetical protein
MCLGVDAFQPWFRERREAREEMKDSRSFSWSVRARAATMSYGRAVIIAMSQFYPWNTGVGNNC